MAARNRCLLPPGCVHRVADLRNKIIVKPSTSIDVIALTQRLVRAESVTARPNTEVSEIMEHELRELGFEIEIHPYADSQGTSKIALAARRCPSEHSHRAVHHPPGLAYFCHNDVVSVDGWDCPHGGAFEAAIAEGRMWGRGTCDMKGSAASALSAASHISPESQQAPLFYFVTGDEECGMRGAELLSIKSPFYREAVERHAVAIVGEPTELQLVNSHKGAYHMEIAARGIAAHSSTTEGDNANWKLIPFLDYLNEVRVRSETDPSLNNEAYDPSTLSPNIVVHNAPASSNITVGKAVCHLFFRPMPDTAWIELGQEIEQRAVACGLEVKKLPPLPPVHTAVERPFVQETLELLGQKSPHAVCYATDGCCLQACEDLIVLGPGSIEQAHRCNEWIALEQLERGVEIFTCLFRKYLGVAKG